jgi:hypothetical protein
VVGGWDVSGVVVDELGGRGTRGGRGAVRFSEVVVVGGVVIVAVDVAVNKCDTICDVVTKGGVPVGGTATLGSGMSSSELGVGILRMIAFIGHSFSNVMQRCSQVSFCVIGRALHHRSASE